MILNNDDIQFLVFCLGIARAKFMEDRQIILNEPNMRDAARQVLAQQLAEHAERTESLGEKLKVSR